MARQKKKKITMVDVLASPRYKGKHVVVIAGKVFAAKTGEKASRILEKVREKYPKAVPAVTYIPDADTLILIWS